MKTFISILLLCTVLGGGVLYFMGVKNTVLADTSGKVKVVELFTSQSCSSCPPADKSLRKLSTRGDIIALSCNVTYWNHLHWVDTLSQTFCTERQSAYSVIAGRAGRIFTPEMIVNGNVSAVGSLSREVSKAVGSQSIAVPMVHINSNKMDELVASLPEIGSLSDEAVVTVVTYGQDLEQKIKRGENRGRSVKYTNPVLAVDYVQDTWNGEAKDIKVQVEDKGLYSHPVKGYVILVHSGVSRVGPIIAAGKYEL